MFTNIFYIKTEKWVLKRLMKERLTAREQKNKYQESCLSLTLGDYHSCKPGLKPVIKVKDKNLQKKIYS